MNTDQHNPLVKNPLKNGHARAAEWLAEVAMTAPPMLANQRIADGDASARPKPCAKYAAGCLRAARAESLRSAGNRARHASRSEIAANHTRDELPPIQRIQRTV